jgi:hypothetical protein
MTPTLITIDRLELDLRGIPPGVAQQAVASLGPVLEQALATRLSAPPASHSGRPRSGLAPTDEIRLERTPSAGALRQVLAERIAATVASRLHPTLPAGQTAPGPTPS